MEGKMKNADERFQHSTSVSFRYSRGHRDMITTRMHDTCKAWKFGDDRDRYKIEKKQKKCIAGKYQRKTNYSCKKVKEKFERCRRHRQ